MELKWMFNRLFANDKSIRQNCVKSLTNFFLHGNTGHWGEGQSYAKKNAMALIEDPGILAGFFL